jgi:hypothetical protein
MHRLRAAHTAHDLKPRQFQILELLHEHGGLAQGDLAREMGVAASVLVTLLNPLEAEGLVARDRDPADRPPPPRHADARRREAPRPRVARAGGDRGRAVHRPRRHPTRAAARPADGDADGLAAETDAACSGEGGRTMKLTVFGATGGVGRQVVEQALGAGHHVTAYVRNPPSSTSPRAAEVHGPPCPACAPPGQRQVRL